MDNPGNTVRDCTTGMLLGEKNTREHFTTLHGRRKKTQAMWTVTPAQD